MGWHAATEENHMRTTHGLIAAAVLTAGALGAAAPTATGAPGAPAAAVPSKPSVASIADSAVSALVGSPRALGTDRQELRPTDTMVDADGTTHVRMERRYDGLPVVGGDLVTHQAADGTLRGVSQTLGSALTLGTTPGVTAAKAGQSVLGSALTRTIDNLRAADTAPRLVVDARTATPRLAWEVTTLGRQDDGTPSRSVSYVDARTGSVLRTVEGIHTADGEGRSLYNGTVPISIAARSGGGYTLTDVAHGNAATTDMGNKQDSSTCSLFGTCTNGTAFTSTDTVYGNGSTSSRESAAVDAHYGGAETFDYYKNVLGRNGIFGDGRGAPSRVHYGKNYVNAFWDGTKMTYGDGDGTSYGPLVSLDVAGHEMSHGVTENTANLTYSGESGGLNEATSDIFGSMVEFYSNTSSDPGDYFIGEQFDKATGQGLRRMDNPSLDGASQSCYDATTKSIDVHYSSGVGNHFYYLLAEGSGAKTIGGRQHSSPTCNGSSVTGIGRTAAEKIWFRALTTYFTSGTTYAQARTATLSAASDLYGASSTQRAAVASAWSAVNVG